MNLRSAAAVVPLLTGREWRPAFSFQGKQSTLIALHEVERIAVRSPGCRSFLTRSRASCLTLRFHCRAVGD
jgi:hypothetical protein